MTRSLVGVGQSHVAAFRDAARVRRERDPIAPRTRVIHTGEAHYAPDLVEADARYTLGTALADAVRHQIVAHNPLLVSVIGGNVHNVLGLLRHERPFDFRLSNESSPEVDLEAELLVESTVALVLKRMAARDLARLRALHATVGPFLQVESPPPLRDSASIEAASEAYFRDAGIARVGVAPAGLRYRLWRLASRLFREAAEDLGCGFVPVPESVRDSDGFLRPELAADATHGNEQYGENLIRELQK